MRVLVLGIGNVMFADEGIGVHFVNLMAKNYKFTSSKNELTLMDGGTLALALTHIISEFDYLIVVDCISANGASVGDVYFFDFLNVPNFISWDGSAHEIEMLQTLHLMELAGDRPTTKILGIVPSRIESSNFSLSDEVIKASNILEKTLLDHLKELDIKCEKVANFTLNYTLDDYAKKGLK